MFMKVKPLRDVVLFPEKPFNKLPADGAEVPTTGEVGRYWKRLLRNEDVELVKEEHEPE